VNETNFLKVSLSSTKIATFQCRKCMNVYCDWNEWWRTERQVWPQHFLLNFRCVVIC